MADLIIFGISQTAEIVHHYFQEDSPYNVVGFTVDQDYIAGSEFLGLPVYEFATIEDVCPPDRYEMFVALSYRDLNKNRACKYSEAKAKKYNLPSYVSSTAGIIGNIKLGDNCLILENQLIQPFVEIGNNVFVWSGVLIGHHCTIGDHCWLTSNASIGGNTTLGPHCFLGLNCTIGHMINIGANSFIGAGAKVLKDVKPKSVFIENGTDLFRLDSDRFMEISKMK